jgi:tRNA U34 5-carboxymethylaminomethyl modifying enzyme MnmG/GidA
MLQEETELPDDFDYERARCLSREMREKLLRQRQTKGAATG